MNIFFPKEPEYETRVSLTLESAKKFLDKGLDVSIEKSFAEHLGSSKKDFEDLGVKVSSRDEGFSNAEIICSVRNISEEELDKIKAGTLLVSFLDPFNEKSLVKKIKEKNISAISMELIPRISRAQSMDVLSSQANLAGYRSVIDAAEQFGKAFPMMMTAAGRVNPAKVMVLGVGVAGLQAIATAKRLGAVVSATDVRSATKEQVESLGGKFIMVEDEESTNAETEGGYAKEMSEEYKKKQAKLLEDNVAKTDIIITTALIPGKPAPKLISKKMVDSMKVGSIIIDLASEFGGNCELTKHGEILNYKSKKIVGPKNLPASVSRDSSRLFAKNVINFLMNSCQSGKFSNFNWEDEVVKETCVIRNLKLKKS